MAHSGSERNTRWWPNPPGILHGRDRYPARPLGPAYLAAAKLNTLAAADAQLFADTGTAIIWVARLIEYGQDRRLFGSF